jgi:hypothetical protein
MLIVELRRIRVNKLVDSVFTGNKQIQKSSSNSAYWSSDYEKRLKALFEAIIAEDIINQPSPDDINTSSKKGKQYRLDI